MSEPRLVTGPNGRTLAVAELGDPTGTPLFALHGTPGALVSRLANEDDVRTAGIRIINYDRPGYGQSDRHRGRRVVECVADVAALADALELDRFYVAGGSGGAPHALALAARLGGRVIAAEAVVCPAPPDAGRLDFFAGMDPENVKEFGWAQEGEDRLQRELSEQAAAMTARLEADPATLLGDFDLAEADRALLERPDTQQVLGDQVRRAFMTGVWGWVDDDLAFLTPWGFDLEEIAVPVTIRYGAKDVLVPAAHGRWLSEHVPGARVFVTDDSGHLESVDDTLADMVDLVSTYPS